MGLHEVIRKILTNEGVERMITYTCDVCRRQCIQKVKPAKWMELNHILRYALVCSAECGKKWFDKVIPEETEKTKMFYRNMPEISGGEE